MPVGQDTAAAGGQQPAAVVAGGTGFVGGIAVRALLAAGWQVVVPARDAARLAGLREAVHHPALITVELPPAPDPAAWRAAVAGSGVAPRAAVAALGGWRLAPDLLDTGPADWQRIVDDHLTAHLTAAQAYAPLIAGQEGAVYVALNGAGSVTPFADAGGISVTGAAQRMLIDVLRVGRLSDRVRFCELVLLAAVVGDGRNIDPATEISADRVADELVRLVIDPSSPAHLIVGGAAVG